MIPAARRWLFWTPRILTILFAAFISIFALDVFEGHPSLGQLLVALGMHLIPTAVLLVTLALAWRWEWVGALVYSALGVLYIVTMWGRFSWDVYALIAGPAFLLGLLFLLGWHYRTELRAHT
jgi:glucose-6-phosphate-specific signal transduction histidine kinase